MPFDRLAQLLIGYSAAVRPGEVVSLLGPPSAEPLLHCLYREVLQAGGHPLVLLQSNAWDSLLCQHGSSDQLAFVNPLETREVEVVDVAVHVLPVPAWQVSEMVDPIRQARWQQARRPLLDRFLRRVAERTLRWTATVFPEPMAQYADELSRALLLDRPDPAAAWQEQGRCQARLIAVLEPVHELRFFSPGGTSLCVGVGGRSWCNGNGRENMPDGEVFTTPIAESVDGIVTFDWPAICGGHAIEGIRLTFRAGRVVDATARRGEAILLALLDQDAGARTVGEVGLGCNYAFAQPVAHPLVDEKIGGTFHLALGLAPPSIGDRGRSSLHCDLIGDLRRGGCIEADGRVISANGRFVDPEWPG